MHRTYQGVVDCNTSISDCNWCRNVSETVGFPLLVPLDVVDVPLAATSEIVNVCVQYSQNVLKWSHTYEG